MPNDCTNLITITCPQEEILTQFIENELMLIEKHNTKHNEFIKIHKRGKLGIIFKLWSAWVPDFEWLENTLNTYQDFWIKNEWREEGGMSGVWVGFIKNNEPRISKLSWMDLSIEEEDHFFRE